MFFLDILAEAKGHAAPIKSKTAPKSSTAPKPAPVSTKVATASTHNAQAKRNVTGRDIFRVTKRSPIGKRRADTPINGTASVTHPSPSRPSNPRRGNQVKDNATLRHLRKDPTSSQKNMNENQTRAQQLSRGRHYDHYQPPLPVAPILGRQLTRSDWPVSRAYKRERTAKRCLVKAEYQTARRADLIDEAKFRGLELDNHEQSYLADVLMIDDGGYNELMDKLGNKQQALEFAQGEVAHYNKELRRERAVAEAAKEKAMCESNERQQQILADTMQMAAEKMDERVEEQKPTIEAHEQEKVKESQNSDSLSELNNRPAAGVGSAEERPKSNKRARPSDDENQESEPTKKARTSAPTNTTKEDTPVAKDDKPVKKMKLSRVAKTNSPPIALPRAMQARMKKTPSVEKGDAEMTDSDEPTTAEPVKGVAVKIKRKKARAANSSQITRKTHADSGDEELEEGGQKREDEETDEDDFIVDDLAYKPKRKSKVGAMARSNLFSGMR